MAFIGQGRPSHILPASLSSFTGSKNSMAPNEYPRSWSAVAAGLVLLLFAANATTGQSLCICPLKKLATINGKKGRARRPMGNTAA